MRLKQVVGDLLPTAPNHCLINEYRPGQGIMPHEDGPLYVPVVATLTVGGNTMLDFYPSSRVESRPETPSSDISSASNFSISSSSSDTSTVIGDPAFSLYTQRRSLYVFSSKAYTDYRHGIAERDFDVVGDETIPRTTRISLTFRVVKKVLKAKIKL
mmetsp:Transcript_45806/g.74731  ORF Transcript_45806/g.74731 Transcript_45806/m.74731 type:complete len:157 (+) Transcript_45806:68-538(+)